jgi:hypothetical protein
MATTKQANAATDNANQTFRDSSSTIKSIEPIIAVALMYRMLFLLFRKAKSWKPSTEKQISENIFLFANTPTI